jgi:peptidoglycan/xylan/chitin deacetylase (PgdA/CDA1 family)
MPVSLKLNRWRRKLGVLSQPNALGMFWRRFATKNIEWPARKLRRPIQSHGIILAYHRVANLEGDPQSLCVAPRHFAEHLDIIQKNFHVLSLQDLVKRLSARESLSGTVAITFDDGYADNLHGAKPLLDRFGVPATVFVTSSYVTSATEFWWDELERLLLQVGTLSPTLHLHVSGHDYFWDLGDDAQYESTAFERNRAWSVKDRSTPTRRHDLYRSLHMILYGLNSPQREDVLDKLRAWAVKDCIGRPTHLPLTQEETVALARDDLVEIGAHTATHPVLSMLPIAEQRIEIQRSKERLEQILERPIRSFAYPYGSLSDYKGETVRAVQEMGFECACSTFTNVVRDGSDPFQLPRFIVRDWDGEEFGGQLRAWTHR